MTQTVVVELCGRLADLAGAEVPVAIPAGGCSVGELLSAVMQHYPALGTDIAAGRVRACVNEAIVRDADRVTPVDVVALFPPVSGG